MTKKPILVTGGSGFIGGCLVSALAKRFHTYFTYFSSSEKIAGLTGIRADLRDRRSILELIEKINPGVVLHLAAVTSFKLCASDPGYAYSVNVEGAKHVAEGAARIGARVINCSTDMVFGGTCSFSTEHDIPDPCCTYGRTKFASEQAMERIVSNLLTVRLSLVYGYSVTASKCHTQQSMKKLLEGETIALFKNEFRTPLYIGDLINILLKMSFCEEVRGILHLCGSERLSRYQFGALIAKSMSLPKDRLVPVSSEKSPDFTERRPVDCSLRSLRLGTLWHHPLLTPDVGLSLMLKQMLK